MTRIIFFDWDGTLCSKKISELANIKRSKIINEGIDDEEFIKLQHNNNNDHYKIVQELIKKETGIENEDTIKRMQVYFFSFFYLKYFKKNPNEYLLFDFDELLKFKNENNLKFIIVTSLFKEIIIGVLNEIDKDRQLFDDFYAIEDNLLGNKTNFIKKAISKHNKDSPIAMIGDRGDDVESGINNNLKTIFCNYGHGDVSNFDIKIEDPKELIDAIKKLIK